MNITTTASENIYRSRSPWQTAAWIGLLLLGGLYIFGATSDLLADGRAGIPTDHTGTFASMAGISWDTAQHTIPGATAYVTLLERGYALHELVFAILFLTILAIPFRHRQRWAWFASWTPMLANLGYAMTFGAHDTTIGYRSLTALVALPILLLAQIPAFFTRRADTLPVSAPPRGTAGTAEPEPDDGLQRAWWETDRTRLCR